MYTYIKYKIWDDSLRHKYESLWPNSLYHIWDGVISPNEYAQASVKIMFLNKEAYDEYNDEYDISKTLHRQLKNNEPIFRNYPIKYKTKSRLSILEKLDQELSSYSNQNFELYSEQDFYNDMLKVAYCNIKKTNGIKISNRKELRECFIKNKEIIEEQISFFNPSVIVGGNIVDGIIDNNIEWGEDLYISDSKYINVYQIKIKGKLFPFLDMYHPACRKSSVEDRKELLKALITVENNNPGFWENRCGQDCFVTDR